MTNIIMASTIQWMFNLAGLMFLLVLVQEPLYGEANR